MTNIRRMCKASISSRGGGSLNYFPYANDCLVDGLEWNGLMGIRRFGELTFVADCRLESPIPGLTKDPLQKTLSRPNRLWVDLTA